jgi:lysozyme
LTATRTSPAGLTFIASFEGWVDHPYNDPSGFATIGYGHLLHRSPVTLEDRKRWGTITQARGLELLAQDVRAAEACVRLHARPPIQWGYRFDALVSFIFNLGCGPLTDSTNLRAAVCNAARTGMPEAMLPYDHSGGVVLPGLTRRRRAEAHLWETGEYL